MTPGQRRAIAQYWPCYGISVEDGMLDVHACFAKPGPLFIEVGFGMGDSLAETARSRPEINFIGIEVHRPGVGHLLGLAAAAELDNLKLFNADGVDVLSHCIPTGSSDRIQIFFPDPWHKKRHHKRRLITAAFAALLEDRLKPGGVLHVATDWPQYAESIAGTIAEATRLEPVAPPGRLVTKYEKRGRDLGHEVIDLAWSKHWTHSNA
jgi:tRNA (guanine-N7-)-methyltransferase